MKQIDIPEENGKEEGESLHALAGDEMPQLMQVEAVPRGRKVSILVDTGTTHNFICENL